MNSQIVLVHLHLDFEEQLAELMRKWNAAQNQIEFVGVRPSRKFEHPLLPITFKVSEGAGLSQVIAASVR